MTIASLDLEYGDDISFHICKEDGFILSESVCDSDISSWWTEEDEDDNTEALSLDIDDEDFWIDDSEHGTNVLHRGSNSTGKHSSGMVQVLLGRDEFDELSFYQHGKMKIVQAASETESETDDEDDLDDEYDFRVQKCVNLSFTTTTEANDELDSTTTTTTLEVIYCDCFCSCSCSCCCHYASSLEAYRAPISGFELYLTFYGLALVTFLAIKLLPAEVQAFLRLNTTRQSSCRSFQPRENIEFAVLL